MKKIRLLLVLVFISLCLVGCGNKDYGWGNYEFNYITCDEGYINLVNEPIDRWKEDGSYGIEVYLKDGNNLSLNSFKCYLSKYPVEK